MGLAPVVGFAAAALCFLAAAYPLKLYKIRYNPQNRAQRLWLCAAVLLCLVPVFCIFYSLPHENIVYPFAGLLENQNGYEQQFDAFLKGQLHLDFAPDARILALENPYDPTARAETGAWYPWDRALFEGKYYSYFGIAPLLTVYFPYYALTGALPAPQTVCFLLAAVGVLAVATACKALCSRMQFLYAGDGVVRRRGGQSYLYGAVVGGYVLYCGAKRQYPFGAFFAVCFLRIQTAENGKIGYIFDFCRAEFGADGAVAPEFGAVCADSRADILMYLFREGKHANAKICKAVFLCSTDLARCGRRDVVQLRTVWFGAGIRRNLSAYRLRCVAIQLFGDAVFTRAVPLLFPISAAQSDIPVYKTDL